MITFILAILLNKGIITAKEARELNKPGATNNSLPEMVSAVNRILDGANRAPVNEVKTIDAAALLKKD
jgi:hypothetical protein